MSEKVEFHTAAPLQSPRDFVIWIVGDYFNVYLLTGNSAVDNPEALAFQRPAIHIPKRPSVISR